MWASDLVSSYLQASDLVLERREARHKSVNADSGPTRLEKHQISAGIVRIRAAPPQKPLKS